MDATELLAQLQKDFPAARRTGVFKPAPSCAEVFKQLGLPDELALSSRDGWQIDGSVVTLQGYSRDTLLGVKQPALFMRAQPDGAGYRLLLGINLPAHWTFSQSFNDKSQPIFETLLCRALLVASAPLAVPVEWLRQVSEAKRDKATPGNAGPQLQVDPGASLYGWDAKADASIGVDALATLLTQRNVKFSLALELARPDATQALAPESPEVVAVLPTPDIEVQRNETWCAFNPDTRQLTHAYLALYAFGAEGWPVWPEVLTLGDVQLRFSSLHPPQHQSIQSFSLGAVFTLGGIPLLIKAHLPATTFSGSLDPRREPPSLKDFVQTLFHYEMSGDMKIHRLEFWARREQRLYGAALGIEGDWKIDIDPQRYLAFQRLEVEMQRDLEGTRGSLQGAFRIDADNEFDIRLDLAKGARVKGSWQRSGNPVEFNAILRSLHLPEFDALSNGLQLQLSKAEFDFDSASTSMTLTFSARLYNPANPQDSPQIEALLVAARNTESKKWGYLCSMQVDLKLQLGLENIPLAGKLIAPDSDALRVDRLRLIAATKVVPALPDKNPLLELSKQPLDSGLALAVDLGVGEEPPRTLMVRFGNKAKQPPKPTLAPAPGAAAAAPADNPAEPEDDEAQDEGADKVGWLDIQRSFGPLHLQRIGFTMANGAIGVLLDGGLDTRGLNIQLSGLRADIPLLVAGKRPEYDLAGLALHYRSASLNIGGAMARRGPRENPSYDGELAVNAGRFGATAMGSYAEINGMQSFTAYTFIDFPLGGPPCFFVTGLAGGLGFNRALRLPEVDNIAQFPLIRAAMGDPDNDKTKKSLSEYITVAPGQDWFAAGVRFSSFKMLESFALLTLSFGARSEVALLGQSTLNLPPSAPGKQTLTVVHADLLLKACLQLEEGLLAVNAQLSANSWIFSRDARLTGGFAFYLWFGNSPHAGDFVVTLGGYHPQFKVPAHYPQVPRLGLNWKVSSNLTLKGELYFALTPALIMAGGLLDATWQSSGVQAWFQVQTHFLIRFKPFTYRISATISIGVSVQVDLWVSSYTLNARVNANLDLWGPDFGGLALVDLSVVSFTMDFGSRQRPSDQPIDWKEFRESFLPTDVPGKPCALIAISAPAGMLGSSEEDGPTQWRVDPANLRLELNHQIPVTLIDGRFAPAKCDWNQRLGVAPMGQGEGSLRSVIKVTLRRNGKADTGTWNSRRLLGGVPAGLWGNPGASLQGTAMLDNALLGLDLSPTAEANATAIEVASSVLQAAQPLSLACAWSASLPDQASYAEDNTLAQLADSLLDSQVSSARTGILDALHRQGLAGDAEIRLKRTASASAPLFTVAPTLCALGAP